MPRIWTVTIGDPKSVKEFGDKFRELENGNWVFEVKKNRPIRSLSQNRFYHVVLKIIGIETGHTHEQLHELMKRMFNSDVIHLPKGGTQIVGKSTATLSDVEFLGYVNRVKDWALSEYSIIIPTREQMDTARELAINTAYSENQMG